MYETNSRTDPFDKVIGDLGRAFSQIQDVQKLIKPADEIVLGADHFLHALHDTVPVLRVIRETSNTLVLASKPLDAIPGLDVVVEVVGEIGTFANVALADLLKVAGTVDNEAIKPGMKLMNKVHSGLGTTEHMAITASVKIPQYLNTVTILSYLLEIGTPLMEVLEGSEPGKRLNDFVDNLNGIRRRVTGPLKQFLDILTPIIEAMRYIVDKIDGLRDSGILDPVNWVANKINEIYENVMKVLSAIAPVRWALEAVQWVMEKVVTPVLKKILEVTGLDKLEHAIIDKIEEKLGVKHLFDAAGKLDGGGMDGAHPEHANKAADIFIALGKDLEKYSGNKNEAVKDAVRDLIHIFLGTPVDRNKAADVPKWDPDPPKLYGVDSEVILERSGPSNWINSTCQRAFSAVAGTHSTVAGESYSAPLLLTPLLLGTDDNDNVFPPIDAKKWPNAYNLQKEICALIEKANHLQSSGQTLKSAIHSLDKSFQLPMAFSDQTTDLVKSLDSAGDALAFVENFNFTKLNEIVKAVKSVVETQAAYAHQVSEETPRLCTAVQSLEKAAQSVMAAIPKMTVLAHTTTTLDGWTISINQLVQAVDTAARYDAEDGHKHESDLTDLREHIEHSAAQVQKRLSTIDSKVKSLDNRLTELQGALDNYANVLNPISRHSQKLSESLPALHKLAYTLVIADSIFDPLEGLLTAGGCVDSEDDSKQYATRVQGILQKTSETKATPQVGELDRIANAVRPETLPLEALAKDMVDAAKQINGNIVNVFNTKAKGLESDLKEMGEALGSTQFYTMRGGDSDMLRINNDFIDQSFVDKAEALLKIIPVPTHD